MRTTLLTLALLFSTVSMSKADSWVAPSPKLFSTEDGDKGLKIIPGKDGKSTASWVHWKADGSEEASKPFPLVNTPVRAIVPSLGLDYFVTLDTYGGMGGPHTLVIYNEAGAVIRDLKLEDLLTDEEIAAHVTQSVSSRWWRTGADLKIEIPDFPKTAGESAHRTVFPRPDRENARLKITFPWGKVETVRLKDGEVGGID